MAEWTMEQKKANKQANDETKKLLIENKLWKENAKDSKRNKDIRWSKVKGRENETEKQWIIDQQVILRTSKTTKWSIRDRGQKIIKTNLWTLDSPVDR